jgi:hypothetical protein
MRRMQGNLKRAPCRESLHISDDDDVEVSTGDEDAGV